MFLFCSFFLQAVGIFQIAWEHGEFHWYKAPADGRIQAGLKQRFCAWGRRGVACQICAAEAQAAHIHQGSRPSWELGEALTSGSQEQVASPSGAPTQDIPKRKLQGARLCAPTPAWSVLDFGWEGSGPASPQPGHIWGKCHCRRRRRRPSFRHPGYTGGTCGACNIDTRK